MQVRMKMRRAGVLLIILEAFVSGLVLDVCSLGSFKIRLADNQLNANNAFSFVVHDDDRTGVQKSMQI